MFPVTSQHRTHQAAQFEHLRLKSRRTETEHSCLKSTEHHFPALNIDNRNVHSDASTPSEHHCGRGIANFCVNQFIAPNVSAYYFMLWLWLGHLLFMSPVIQKNHWLSGLSHYCWQSVEDHQFCACSLVSNLSGVEYQDMQRVDLFLLINKADNQ